jgi:hypothetical protein
MAEQSPDNDSIGDAVEISIKVGAGKPLPRVSPR